MKTETILLIDDNPINNQLVATYLLPCGYTIQIAENGADGLRMAVEDPPDLILLDVMMPDMDGYEVCRRLRRTPNTAQTPILFITADASPENHKRAFSVGGNDFITKPIYESVLRARVENLINLFNSRRELETLNRLFTLSQQISLTGHWMCIQNIGRKPECSCSDQLVQTLEIDSTKVADLAINEFLLALTSEAIDRERLVKRWISAQSNAEDFRELIACRINGKIKYLRVWVQFEKEVNLLKAFGSVQDVTGLMLMLYEESKLQNRVANSDRYNSMVESGTQLAHELNQPLTSITLNVNATKMFLRDGDFDKDELCEILQDVEAEVMRAKEVVERMRTVANRKPLQLESFDLHELIRTTTHIFERDFTTDNITFFHSALEQPCLVKADKGAIQQVLVNVIKNAYDSLSDSPVEDPRVVLSICESDEMMCIHVSDNGVGVNPSVATTLFSPFVTTKPDKLGLGLAICTSIATRLGGTIEHLPDDTGQGAIFRIMIPKNLSVV